MTSMNTLFKDFKEEAVPNASFYLDLDKSAVIQEARIFNKTPLNVKKCMQVLTKILIILSRGDNLTKNEATETFFAITKLFQCNNFGIRRILYLVIKELSSQAEDVIIVTSSLTKDMNGHDQAFRGPAIRALCKITDPSLMQSLDRFLKQAIVDKNPSISTSVLTCTYRMSFSSPDLVRKWTNEIQEATCNTKPMVQYHSIGFLYQMRKNDQQAVTKLIHKFTRSSVRSPFAHCLLIRIVTYQIMEKGFENSRDLLDFLESALRSKSEMVIFEAAKAIISLLNVSSKELAPAVSVLQLGCSSRQVMRYAAVKTLSIVATRFPAAVIACDMDLENLTTDNNRSIATLAVTTLLKTGSESSIERLLKHIFSIMNDISDEFKLAVLESIRMLAVKYPKKFSVLLNFLSSLLRETSSYTFKKSVVLVFESILQDIPESKSLGLLLLCDFIEDCEHTKLIEKILYLIGMEGSYLERPRDFTRFIYNRIMLESAPVKCTATTALARFGAQNEEILPSILVLLKRIMHDEDDEVRDRASFYYYLLTKQETVHKSSCILTEPMKFNSSILERSILSYLQNTPSQAKVALTPSLVLIEPQLGIERLVHTNNINKTTLDFVNLDKGAKTSTTSRLFDSSRANSKCDPQSQYAKEFAAHSKLASLGPIFKSSQPEPLTETETEYVVTCVKHILQHYLVLQFNCVNTMSDQVLTQINIQATPDEPDFQVLGLIPCLELSYNQPEPGRAYAIVKLPDDISSCTCNFECCMKFIVHDVDPNSPPLKFDSITPGFNDEYVLEQVNLSLSDHISRVSIPDFFSSWRSMPEELEVTETFSMNMYDCLEQTVQELVKHLGMQPCERSDHTDKNNASHQLLLAGAFRGHTEILARCDMLYQASKGVTLKIACRSHNKDLCHLVCESIA